MPKSKKSKDDSSNTLERLVPVLLVATVGLAFFVGVLWQKVSNMEGTASNNKVAGAEDAGNQPNQPKQPVNGKLSEDQAKKIATVSSIDEGTEADNTKAIDEKDHVRGSLDAKVYLIEYSDLECPFCKKFHDTAMQAVDEYDGQVAWVYRHFPLDALHPKARTEALAVECAKDQGGNDGFWALTDKIYEVTPSNNGLNLDDLPSLAEDVGLNGDELQTCIDNEKFAKHVDDDYQEGIEAGVTGTPGNFIMNDKGEVWAVPGAVPYETLKGTIDEALQS